MRDLAQLEVEMNKKAGSNTLTLKSTSRIFGLSILE